MIASIGRHLHQPIDVILEWDDTEFFAWHDAMRRLLDAERPRS